MTGDGSGELTAQQTLVGDEAERVECEYYDGCHGNALYIDEILHYEESEQPVKMCESCADEHMEVEGNDVQRLKPEDRYEPAENESEATVWVVASRKEDSPHPYVEKVYDNQEAAEEHLSELSDNSFQHGVVAWSVFQADVKEALDL